MNLPTTFTPDAPEGMDAFRQSKLAARIANRAHDEQYRRDGFTPYLSHVRAVVRRVAEFGGDDKALAIAWLHDVLEDTKETEHSLEQAGICPEIIVAVRALTHKDLSYYAYIKEIKTHPNPRVLMVKLSDVISNLADKPTPAQIKKYGQALGILTSDLFSPFTGNK